MFSGVSVRSAGVHHPSHCFDRVLIIIIKKTRILSEIEALVSYIILLEQYSQE
jgi:hypothetical protein